MPGGATVQLTQVNFRARGDTVGLNVDTWDHALNANFAVASGTPFRVRFTVAETGGGMANNRAYVLQFNREGAGFVAVGLDTAVRLVASSQFDHLDPTTQLISSGSFVAGVGITETTTTNISLQNQRTEIEWCLQLFNVDDEDEIVLRVVEESGTVLNIYSNSPTITAEVEAVAPYAVVSWAEIQAVESEDTGDTTPVSITASLSGTNTLSRLAGKLLFPAPAGFVDTRRGAGKAVAAALAGSVSTMLIVARALAASIAASVAVNAQKVFLVFVTAIASTSASLMRGVGKGINVAGPGLVDIARQLTLSQAISASLTGTVATARSMGKAISATTLGAAAVDASKAFIVAIQAALAGTVGIGRAIAVSLQVSAAVSVAVVRSATARVSAAASGAASVTRSVGKRIATSAIGAAAMARSVGKVIALSAQAVADVTADFIAGVGEVFNQAITASLTASATVSRSMGKSLRAALDAAVDTTRALDKALGATCSGAASVVKFAGKGIATSAIGNAAVNAGKALIVAISATVNGTVTIARSAGKLVTAALGGMAQQLPRVIGKVVAASSSSFVAVGKAISASLSVSLDAFASARKTLPVAVRAVVSAASSVAALFISAADALIRRIALAGRKAAATLIGRKAAATLIGRKADKDLKGGV